MHSQRFWIISESECRRQMSSYHIMASVLVRSRKFWNKSPERAHTNTATVHEYAPRDVGPSAIGRKTKGMQGSWVVSVSKWFADEKEDTGLQTAETSKFFGIASLIKSSSNEGKELIIQYQARSSICQASSSKQRRPTQRTPGNLVRSSECLSKCCHAFNPTCDQEECDC